MRKITTQEFIDRARAVHGNKYGYAFSVYQSAHEKIMIHCRFHGMFEQSRASHTNGNGCPFCGVDSQKITREEFIEKATNLHGNKYDYNFVNYVNNATKVKIVCQEHGCFSQTPYNHVRGQGCPTCGVELQKLTREEFIEKSTEIHGDKYDYSGVWYTHSHKKVTVVCREHGVFSVRPNNHLSGQECPGCANHGFDRTKVSFLCVLRSDCGTMMKIGVTNKPDQRKSQLLRVTPFLFERIELIEGDGEKIAELEKKLLNHHQQITFDNSFNGSTEWRLWDSSVVNQIKQERIKYGKN